MMLVTLSSPPAHLVLDSAFPYQSIHPYADLLQEESLAQLVYSSKLMHNPAQLVVARALLSTRITELIFTVILVTYRCMRINFSHWVIQWMQQFQWNFVNWDESKPQLGAYFVLGATSVTPYGHVSWTRQLCITRHFLQYFASFEKNSIIFIT